MIFLFTRRRRNIIADARRARGDQWARIAGLSVVVAYNVIGLLDVFSTVVAIRAGGVEANPLIRSLMESDLIGWVPAKLGLQFLVTAMVLWFPHRFVVGIFGVAVLINGAVVLNNIRLAIVL